jgi:hypothetical protein
MAGGGIEASRCAARAWASWAQGCWRRSQLAASAMAQAAEAPSTRPQWRRQCCSFAPGRRCRSFTLNQSTARLREGEFSCMLYLMLLAVLNFWLHTSVYVRFAFSLCVHEDIHMLKYWRNLWIWNGHSFPIFFCRTLLEKWACFVISGWVVLYLGLGKASNIFPE